MVTWEIVTPRKLITLVFEGWQLPMLPSGAVNIYYIIQDISVIKSVHRLHFFRFQIQVKWIFVFVFSTPHAHKFCAVDIFWNITRRQAISPVAKSCHVLGRGFMIHWVILNFIKCLSANQNRLFYMKVQYNDITQHKTYATLNSWIC